ncbi:methyltransferase [Colletotrichum filicis]|nr:methyltransferase [Colletotrichum filicis]
MRCLHVSVASALQKIQIFAITTKRRQATLVPTYDKPQKSRFLGWHYLKASCTSFESPQLCQKTVAARAGIIIPGSISEVEAQPVQPTAASTADVPSTSADIEVDNENDASTMDDRATEMGDFFPNAEVTGIDLSPIQPSWVPPNVKVEVDDVESP